jgi:hypothetical protein
MFDVEVSPMLHEPLDGIEIFHDKR